MLEEKRATRGVGGEERDKRDWERQDVAACTLHLQLNAVQHLCLYIVRCGVKCEKWSQRYSKITLLQTLRPRPSPVP